MTGKRDADDTGLTAFFDAARASTPEPGAALLARVLDDAESAQAAMVAPRRAPSRPAGIDWGGVWRAFGGWPSMAGLVTATLAGVWIGTVSPDVLNGPLQAVLGSGTEMVIDAEPVTAFLMTGEAM